MEMGHSCFERETPNVLAQTKSPMKGFLFADSSLF
jgi:hypothetical protein